MSYKTFLNNKRITGCYNGRYTKDWHNWYAQCWENQDADKDHRKN